MGRMCYDIENSIYSSFCLPQGFVQQSACGAAVRYQAAVPSDQPREGGVCWYEL